MVSINDWTCGHRLGASRLAMLRAGGFFQFPGLKTPEIEKTLISLPVAGRAVPSQRAIALSSKTSNP